VQELEEQVVDVDVLLGARFEESAVLFGGHQDPLLREYLPGFKRNVLLVSDEDQWDVLYTF